MLKKLVIITIAALCISACGNQAVLVPVAAGSWFNFDRRTTKTIIDDQTLTLKANLAIAKNKPIWRESHVSTLSYNNAILLVGQTKNQRYKQDIENMVRKIEGVGTIYNQISVGCPISMATRTNDTWLTTQVKSRIMTNRDVGINRVKVITEDSTVYLMGALTQDEQATAIKIARCVPGVKKVVTVLERQADVSGTPPPIPVPKGDCQVSLDNCQ